MRESCCSRAQSVVSQARLDLRFQLHREVCGALNDQFRIGPGRTGVFRRQGGWEVDAGLGGSAGRHWCNRISDLHILNSGIRINGSSCSRSAFILRLDSASAVKRLKSDQGRINVVVCYCSLYGECWKVTRQSNRPRPGSCEEPATSFRDPGRSFSYPQARVKQQAERPLFLQKRPFLYSIFV